MLKLTRGNFQAGKAGLAPWPQTFPGTVYLIPLSERPDQGLPFALAVFHRERGLALGILNVGLRFANPTYAVKTGEQRRWIPDQVRDDGGGSRDYGGKAGST